jgi:hypothetical protein
VRALLALTLCLPLAAWGPAAQRGVPDLTSYPWLYLRGGEPLAPGEEAVELIAVGDVMPGRGVTGEPEPLAAVAPWLRATDLALGNLECVIAVGGTPRPGPYRLRAPLPAVATLRQAGFDLLGLANNHALDYGPAALAETASRLEEAGIAAVGTGATPGAAAQATIREVSGVRLAFLAFNTVPDPDDVDESGGWAPVRWDPAMATAGVATARQQADAVIVSMHWGYEYEVRPDPAQRDIAQALLDAGADLVVGHHPHVVQGTQVGLRASVENPGAPQGQFVAYSLGNLLFDQGSGETRQGLALRAFFDDRGLRAVQALPLWAGRHPRLMDPSEAESLLARVEPPPVRIGFACDDQSCHPAPVRPMEATGSLQGGEIDLTGDGVPEEVHLEGKQLLVSSGGAEVWRGLPEWQVMDVALGDPNDDGRGEMVLALRKPDAAGVLRSQPFIVGYRGGAYRILWGGSPVVDPICEVELGDLDGDGRQELVVLEEQGDQSAVSVWRWHGWGFSLIWRSAPRRYRDLTLVPAQAGSPPSIGVMLDPRIVLEGRNGQELPGRVVGARGE